MATYALGDVQGCFDELQTLLAQIHFDPAHDRLRFCGDLVNRGPQSLAVLRFVKELPGAIVTLGNHDLYLLALLAGGDSPQHTHTLQAVLEAPDRDELSLWLRHQPLFYCDEELGYAMVHAGVPPQWTLAETQQYAQEVMALLQSDKWQELMANIYSNLPVQWQPTLSGWPRIRYIVNALTRMRFCDADGRLELIYKGTIGAQPVGYLPWFQIPGRRSTSLRILFGHWAALRGKTDAADIYALDTGCIWGDCLTAMRLEDGQRFSVPCHQATASFVKR